MKALIAVLPGFFGGSQPPVVSLALTMGAVFVTGMIWTWLAVSAAIRGHLLEALRNE